MNEALSTPNSARDNMSDLSRTSSSAMLINAHEQSLDNIHMADMKASASSSQLRAMTPQDVQTNHNLQQNHVLHVPRFRAIKALVEKLRILIIGDRSFIWIFLTVLGICAGFLGFVHDAAIAEIYSRT